VSRVVNEHSNQLIACYEKVLIADPGLAGKITLDWTVKTDGLVKDVRVAVLDAVESEGRRLRGRRRQGLEVPEAGRWRSADQLPVPVPLQRLIAPALDLVRPRRRRTLRAPAGR
jgi:hypothetical protein